MQVSRLSWQRIGRRATPAKKTSRKGGLFDVGN